MPGSRPPCAALWNTPTVHLDGTVTTCCLDEHLHNALGNLRDTPLRELWYGERIERWRRAQVEGRFEDSGPFCTRCNWRSAGALAPERARRWLADRGEGSAGSGPGEPRSSGEHPAPDPG